MSTSRKESESCSTVAVDTTTEEKKEEDTGVTVDDDYDDKTQAQLCTLFAHAVESDDVEPNSSHNALWKKVWDSMNPAVCLSPVTACHGVFMDDEVVDYNRLVPPMLRELKHAGKMRSSALQRLYRFTDRDRHKNRCV